MSRLGGVDLKQIAEIAKEAPSDRAGSSAMERFIRTVTKLVEQRHTIGEASGLSVFLRSQTVNDDVKDRQTVPLPCLCNGNDPISQRIMISDTLLGRAYMLSMDVDQYVLDNIEKQGLGQLPALVVDWRGDSPKAMFWPMGVANGEPIQLYLSDHEITPLEMKSILDDFFDLRLRTPTRITDGHGQPVWSDASRGWPASRPEERIQGILITFLRGRLQHDIRPEIPNAEGRLDVQISARLHDTNGDRMVKKIWILELKALADKTSTGNDVPVNTVIDGIRKGVNQAYSYREAEHANRAALCCFDLRKEDLGDQDVFAPIADEASDNSVYLWRWFLYRTSQAGRVAAAAAKI